MNPNPSAPLAPPPVNDGGPAFPMQRIIADYPRVEAENHSGLSIRDYFAAKAMQPLIEPEIVSVDTAHIKKTVKIYAGISYLIADAMLAERAKKGGSK